MEGARQARPEDVDRLVELLELAIMATTNDRGASLYRYPERLNEARSRIAAALGDPGVLLLAGEIDGYVVGLTIATVDLQAPNGPLGVVEELYVEEDARGVGVGEAMLDTAVDWCREQRCTGVDIAALPGDRAGKNLCERSGFRARLLVMHRALDG